MTPQAQEEKKAAAESGHPFGKVFERPSSSPALSWAIFGCLAAGGVGIVKALGMESPVGVLLCLLGSVAAFGLVIYIHLRKH